jgi:hypothetical protein
MQPAWYICTSPTATRSSGTLRSPHLQLHQRPTMCAWHASKRRACHGPDSACKSCHVRQKRAPNQIIRATYRRAVSGQLGMLEGRRGDGMFGWMNWLDGRMRPRNGIGPVLKDGVGQTFGESVSVSCLAWSEVSLSQLCGRLGHMLVTLARWTKVDMRFTK